MTFGLESKNDYIARSLNPTENHHISFSLSMSKATDYIASGILELYVLGMTNGEESKEVERMAKLHPTINAEIEAISESLVAGASQQAHTGGPNPTTKAFIMAMIDYSERMKAGEVPAFPPVLTEASTAADYAAWLNRPDMTLPDGFKDYHARVIGYTPQCITAIVWIKDTAPPEIHDQAYEKFLVLEGSCDIEIEGDRIHSLVPGNYLSIPLHKWHEVRITSTQPCKVILQRLAA